LAFETFSELLLPIRRKVKTGRAKDTQTTNADDDFVFGGMGKEPRMNSNAHEFFWGEQTMNALELDVEAGIKQPLTFSSNSCSFVSIRG